MLSRTSMAESVAASTVLIRQIKVLEGTCLENHKGDDKIDTWSYKITQNSLQTYDGCNLLERKESITSRQQD